MLPILWLSSCPHWTSLSANNSPDANEHVPPPLSLSYHACGLTYWSGKIDQEGDDTATLHDLLRFECSWSGLPSGAAVFASVPLYRLQLELHEKVEALTAWDPPVRSSTEVVSEAAATNLETGDLFCLFHSLYKITKILILRKWDEQFSVRQKHICQRSICIPQLKQANG